MRTARLTVVAALLAAAAPAAARSEASIVGYDVPLGKERALAASTAPPRFNLVGLHWQGAGTVQFRTRSASGRWSAWRAAAPEPEDGPDRDDPERTRAPWRLGNPYWTGPADRIEYRLRGVVRRLRAWFVWSPVEETPPARTLALAAPPPVVPRAAWGANELIRRGAPKYADRLQFAVVHHTAGSNSYTRAQSPAIVRAIQLYHVRGNGWNDIGYNLLVDKYGQVFEGRYGGVERNVIGAHAGGFNTGSVGIAVLGDYGGQGITAAARQALVRTLAWRLDVAHVDPVALLSVTSNGNSRFPRGAPVFLRSIVGHRDTGFTTCPGELLYRQLNGLASAVAATGGPKLYDPIVTGRLGAPIRFFARLSAPLPWSVTISDARGQPIAAGTGTGTSVDWTWDASRAVPGSYSYTIAAGTGTTAARPAVGLLGTREAALALTQARAVPATITPNGDGRDDSTVVSYRLAAPAVVTATLTDAAGKPLSTLFSEPKLPGLQRFAFTADGVADGRYRIVLSAVGSSGRTVTARVAVVVTRTLAAFATQRAFSPNRDRRRDLLELTFTLASPAQVRLRILRGSALVATPLTAPLAAGRHRITWDGRAGTDRVADGAYVAELAVTDGVAGAGAVVVQRAPFAVDTAPPSLRLVSVRPLRFRLSEPARLVLVVDGRRRVLDVRRAGVVAVSTRPRRLSAYAEDAAGNRSRTLRYP